MASETTSDARETVSDAYSFKGRKPIFIDEVGITASNIIEILQKCTSIHRQNVEEIQYLMNYERGIQPILNREKKIREDINYKVVENAAAQIVDFKIGYEFSQPVTYVQRAQKDSHGNHEAKGTDTISRLNQMMDEEGAPGKNMELARNFKICGVGYKMILPKDDDEMEDLSPFKIAVLDPRCAFVARWNDAFREPALGVTFIEREDKSLKFGCYTKDWYFEIDRMKIANSQVNPLGVIPIIEYENDYSRMGSFERVMPLLNAINIINSDRINSIAQHVQALLWLNNAEIDANQISALKDQGVIQTKSNGGTQASIEYLESVLNQSEVQALVDYEYSRVLEITHVPNRQDPNGGSTTGATNLSSGWMDADMAAKSAETMFSRGERRANRVVLSILRMHDSVDSDMADLKLSDIEIKFSRNKTYDLATKANSLAVLLKSGIDGLRALETVGLFTDPQQTWDDSREMIQKVQGSGKSGSEQSTNRPEDFSPTDVKPQPSEVTNIANE